MQQEEQKQPQIVEQREGIEQLEKYEIETQEQLEKILQDTSKAQELLEKIDIENSKENEDQNSSQVEKIQVVQKNQENVEDKEGNFPRMDDKFFRKLLKDNRLYYWTRELNEKLYLHYKGFKYIENLH